MGLSGIGIKARKWSGCSAWFINDILSRRSNICCEQQCLAVLPLHGPWVAAGLTRAQVEVQSLRSLRRILPGPLRQFLNCRCTRSEQHGLSSAPFFVRRMFRITNLSWDAGIHKRFHACDRIWNRLSEFRFTCQRRGYCQSSVLSAYLPILVWWFWAIWQNCSSQNSLEFGSPKKSFQACPRTTRRLRELNSCAQTQ